MTYSVRVLILLTILLTQSIGSVFAADGLITIKSSHDVKSTMDKLQVIVEYAGMNVFTQVDHTAGAAKAGLSLRPTQLLIFGNPKVGTLLMNCSQSIAIDLPQKVLVWEDKNGDVWLSYNDPTYLKNRHETTGCEAVFEKITDALSKFATAATTE